MTSCCLHILSCPLQRWTNPAGLGPKGTTLALGPWRCEASAECRRHYGYISVCWSFCKMLPSRGSPTGWLDLFFSSIRHWNWHKQAFFEYASRYWHLGVCVCVCLHVFLLHFLCTEFEVMDYLSQSLIQQGKSLWQTPSSFKFSLSWKSYAAVISQSLFWIWVVYLVAYWKYRSSHHRATSVLLAIAVGSVRNLVLHDMHLMCALVNSVKLTFSVCSYIMPASCCSVGTCLCMSESFHQVTGKCQEEGCKQQ